MQTSAVSLVQLSWQLCAYFTIGHVIELCVPSKILQIAIDADAV